MISEETPVEAKEWDLEPETEYRFELDPGTSLAVKVRDCIYLISSDRSLSLLVGAWPRRGIWG